MRKTPTVTRRNVAKNVRRFREEAHLSAAEAAKRLGVHRSWWPMLENLKINVGVDKLEEIAEILKVSVCELIRPSRKKKTA